MIAAITNNIDGVKQLLNKGSNILQKDFFNRDALYYAIINNHREIIQTMAEISIYKMANGSNSVYDQTYGNALHISAMHA